MRESYFEIVIRYNKPKNRKEKNGWTVVDETHFDFVASKGTRRNTIAVCCKMIIQSALEMSYQRMYR